MNQTTQEEYTICDVCNEMKIIAESFKAINLVVCSECQNKPITMIYREHNREVLMDEEMKRMRRHN
jgi:hypothetical protein